MKYQDIVFLQGEEAIPALDTLKILGEAQALRYLKQWDYGDSPETDKKNWGKEDKIYRKDEYIMSYNVKLGYIGLCKKDIQKPYDKRFWKIP